MGERNKIMEIRKLTPLKVIMAVLFVLAVVLTTFCATSCLQKNSMTREEKLARFIEENPRLQKNQIVFAGDSITEQYQLDRFYKDSSLDCYNRGISGDTTDNLLYRLQVSVLDIAPSKIVLTIGTNDINAGKSVGEIIENYQMIMELIVLNLPNTELYCVSIIPQNEKYSKNAYENNQRIKSTNKEIERLSKEYNCEYVNLYENLVDKNGLLRKKYSRDGLHLNKKGYKVWTAVMNGFLF